MSVSLVKSPVRFTTASVPTSQLRQGDRVQTAAGVVELIGPVREVGNVYGVPVYGVSTLLRQPSTDSDAVRYLVDQTGSYYLQGTDYATWSRQARR